MKKIILAFACLALVLSSCEEFLTKEPPKNVPDTDALSTFEGINTATNGNYIGFASWYGEIVPVVFDVMCGNAMVGPINTGRMWTQAAWDYTPNGEIGVYGAGYGALLGVNKVLEAIESNSFSRGNTVTQADINNVKAENMALRALIYFDMVRIYGQSYSYIVENGITGDAALGVPLVTKDDLTARPSRATVAAVYDFIIKELEEAEKLMEPSYQRLGSNKLSVKILTVIQASLACVILEHKDYQLAAEYAKKVIDTTSKYKILSGDTYLGMWSGLHGDVLPAPYNGEIIFELLITKSDQLFTGLGFYLTGPDETSSDGYGDVRMSNDLKELFDATDIRLTGMTKPYDKKKDPDGKYLWSTKYPGKKYDQKHELGYNNVPIIRLPEMYLILAEALFRGANVPGETAIANLNKVATNRGAAPYSQATIANIFEEARKEFFLEGHIFFDMKRLQLSLVRTDYNLDMNKDVPFPSTMWALPIPRHEIANNKNIVQNPAYNVQ